MILFVLGFHYPTLNAQTPINVGPQTSTFIGTMVRGYWFTAPVNFTICQLYVEDEMNTEMQHVEVIRLNAAPPIFPTATNAFTSLFYQNNWVPNTPIPCNINILNGDIIGVFGARGNTTTMYNSYGNAPWVTPIYGNNATLVYSGMQFPLNNQQMHDVWQANFSRISRVTMYVDCAPLAIDLISFTGKAIEENAKLNWAVEPGSTCSYFILERSISGWDFQQIAEIPFNSPQSNEFEFVDLQPGPGIIYYRLKMFDQDGSEEYSNTVAIEFEDNRSFDVWPNPCSTAGFNVRLNPIEGDIHYSLTDITGKIMMSEIIPSNGNLQNGFVVQPSHISPGLYLLQVSTHKWSESKRIIIH